MDENTLFDKWAQEESQVEPVAESVVETVNEVVTEPVSEVETTPMEELVQEETAEVIEENVVESVANIEENQENVVNEVASAVASEVASADTTLDVEPIAPLDLANEPKEKKKPGKVVRALAFTGKAIVFGLIAGVVMVCVSLVSDKVLDRGEKQPQSVTVVEPSDLLMKPVETTSGYQMTGQIMDVSGIVDKAMPSAVAITGNVKTTYFSFWGPGYESQSPVSGSGIIIGQNENELLIVTNAHVVNEVSDLKVTFIDGTSASLTVKGAKSNRDIAVVAVALSDLSKDTLEAIAIVEVGDSNALRMGQPVIAIGNALGEGQSSTVGWISALNRTITISGTEYENLIMTDAAINPGNSGGALLNAQGQLIGINSAKYTDEKVEGMGYAIPISAVSDIINDLMTREVRNKVAEDKIGYLGISGMNIDSSISKDYGWPVGALITKIGEKSPAEKSGLLKNDIIVAFDKQEIKTFEELRALMEYYAEGETITVDFYRLENGEYVLNHIDVTLGNRKNAE